MSCLFGQSSHIGQSAHIFGQVGANSSVCSHVWTGLRGFDLRPKLDAWAERRLQACISAEQPAQVDFSLKWARFSSNTKLFIYCIVCLLHAQSLSMVSPLQVADYLRASAALRFSNDPLAIKMVLQHLFAFTPTLLETSLFNCSAAFCVQRALQHWISGSRCKRALTEQFIMAFSCLL